MKRTPRVLALCAVLILLPAAAALAETAAPAPITVGIFVPEKAYITEFAGPLDVYHHVPQDKLRVVLISSSSKSMQSYEGMSYQANYTIDDAPKLDVLVVTSGVGSLDSELKNPKTVAWLKKEASQARFVTSHCEGAFLLGAAGLLDGKNATTFPTDRTSLQKMFPSAKVNTTARFVVDGNLVTSGGGVASYEAALYVVGQLMGKEEAARIGKALVFGESNIAEASRH
jgi:transcriptional regulator GlxA family with amidase domain